MNFNFGFRIVGFSKTTILDKKCRENFQIQITTSLTHAKGLINAYTPKGQYCSLHA